MKEGYAVACTSGGEFEMERLSLSAGERDAFDFELGLAFAVRV